MLLPKCLSKNIKTYQLSDIAVNNDQNNFRKNKNFKLKINDLPETHTEKFRWSLTVHYNRNTNISPFL